MSNFWYGKRVSLCGGSSLIGTHLAEALIFKGVKELRIVDDFSAGKFSNLTGLVDRHEVEVKRADLREYSSASKAVEGADIVFHLAAQHGGRGYVASHKTELWDNNALDTAIFRACAEQGVQKVIFSSSACAYPIDLQTNSDKYVYLKEDMIDYNNVRQADGAYGMEKLNGEIGLDYYIERGYFKGCSTRSFTVYGPLMGETHAIAALIAKTMIRQDPFEIWGDLNNLQVRNWTYVEDNVAGALLAAEHLDRGAINVGIGQRLTPKDAVEIIWDYMGWTPNEVKWLSDKPIGPRNRVADDSKLKALGWYPRHFFEDGLHKTIDWYVKTHDVEELKKDLERKLTER